MPGVGGNVNQIESVYRYDLCIHQRVPSATQNHHRVDVFVAFEA